MWTVRCGTSADAEAIAQIHDVSWGGTVVGHGVVYDLSTLPALVCLDRAGRVVGALTMQEEGDSLEVVSIDATVSGQASAPRSSKRRKHRDP